MPDIFNVSPEPELTDEEIIANFKFHLPADIDDDYTTYTFAFGVVRKKNNPMVPRTLKQVLKSPDRIEWLAARDLELTAFADQETYKWVEKPAGVQPIKTQILYDLKTDNFGNILKHKCCCISKGYAQIYGETYYEVFSPTSSSS